MTREHMAEVLEEIALLLELKDENPFKVRAYRHGAETVRNYDGDIVQLATENQLAGIKGIGEALRDKLHELASTGSLKFHQDLRAEFPPGSRNSSNSRDLARKKSKPCTRLSASVPSPISRPPARTTGWRVFPDSAGKPRPRSWMPSPCTRNSRAAFC